MEFEGVRIPELDRVPQGLPITGGWLFPIYNPADDSTYGAQIQEIPFLVASDLFRTISWADFDKDRKANNLQAGRTSLIINRVGTRPTSRIAVTEISSNLTGAATEIKANQLVNYVLYNPVDDSISDLAGGGIAFTPIAENRWGENSPPTNLTNQDETNDYLGQHIGAYVAPGQPDAPTNGQVNDVNKEFTFELTAAYPHYTQIKEAGRPNTSATTYLNATTAYQVGNTVHVKNLGGSPAGSLAYYVGGSGNIPDGKVLTNNKDFTGAPYVSTDGSRDIYDVPTAKALEVINNYKNNGGPVAEADINYYGCVIVDDFTDLPNEWLYLNIPGRPLADGGGTVWKWRRYLEAGEA